MTLALSLLLAALAVFLLSTRKFPARERLLIWLIGAGLLCWSGWLVATAPARYGLLRALGDAWFNRGQLGASAIAGAFSRNAETIAQFVPQMLDVFVVAAAVLGLIALLAFTPGDRLERFIRPVILILMGFMLGGVAALALVAIGLGGQVRPRTYLGYVAADDVYDGDTFQLGEVSLRLWGVDAPELRQECRGFSDCGGEARAHLAALVSDALVQCDQKRSSTGRATESFGRPLVRCWVRRPGAAPFDLAAAMIASGYAVPYRGESSFGYARAAADGRNQGLMVGCMLRPDQWRNERAMRRAFEDNRTPPPGAVLYGVCPVMEQAL